jgi:hypothetical protein
MNERIRELAEQAGIKVAIVSRVCGLDLTEWQQEHLAELEKFAELIIRRCAKVADLAQEHECEWIGGNILTQFGVKE